MVDFLCRSLIDFLIYVLVCILFQSFINLVNNIFSSLPKNNPISVFWSLLVPDLLDLSYSLAFHVFYVYACIVI